MKNPRGIPAGVFACGLMPGAVPGGYWIKTGQYLVCKPGAVKRLKTGFPAIRVFSKKIETIQPAKTARDPEKLNVCRYGFIKRPTFQKPGFRKLL